MGVFIFAVSTTFRRREFSSSLADWDFSIFYYQYVTVTSLELKHKSELTLHSCCNSLISWLVYVKNGILNNKITNFLGVFQISGNRKIEYWLLIITEYFPIPPSKLNFLLKKSADEDWPFMLFKKFLLSKYRKQE